MRELALVVERRPRRRAEPAQRRAAAADVEVHRHVEVGAHLPQRVPVLARRGRGSPRSAGRRWCSRRASPSPCARSTSATAPSMSHHGTIAIGNRRCRDRSWISAIASLKMRGAQQPQLGVDRRRRTSARRSRRRSGRGSARRCPCSSIISRRGVDVVGAPGARLDVNPRNSVPTTFVAVGPDHRRAARVAEHVAVARSTSAGRRPRAPAGRGPPSRVARGASRGRAAR